MAREEVKRLGDFTPIPTSYTRPPFSPLPCVIINPFPPPPRDSATTQDFPGAKHEQKPLCPSIKIHIILFHLSPSPSTDSTGAWLTPQIPYPYLILPFLFNNYPSIPCFSPFRGKKTPNCPSPSLPSSIPSPPSFFLSASLLTERTSLFSGGNGNVQTLNLNWAFLYDV